MTWYKHSATIFIKKQYNEKITQIKWQWQRWKNTPEKTYEVWSEDLAERDTREKMIDEEEEEETKGYRVWVSGQKR